MKNILKFYFHISLILRIVISLVVGAAVGITLWLMAEYTNDINLPKVISIISPFGNVFIYMLKMVVVPVIFFSLVLGAGSLPLKKFGIVGVKTIGWYFLTSVFAAIIGVFLALLVNPGSKSRLSDWNQMVSQVSAQSQDVSLDGQAETTFTTLLYSMFQNPFQSLAEGNFLPIIVFSILFGIAVRVCMESSEDHRRSDQLRQLMNMLEACRDAMFIIVDWILEYSPIGVLAMTIVNFALYGPKIVGPYLSVTFGVIGGTVIMIFIVYPILIDRKSVV